MKKETRKNHHLISTATIFDHSKVIKQILHLNSFHYQKTARRNSKIGVEGIHSSYSRCRTFEFLPGKHKLI